MGFSAFKSGTIFFKERNQRGTEYAYGGEFGPYACPGGPSISHLSDFFGSFTTRNYILFFRSFLSSALFVTSISSDFFGRLNDSAFFFANFSGAFLRLSLSNRVFIFYSMKHFSLVRCGSLNLRIFYFEKNTILLHYTSFLCQKKRRLISLTIGVSEAFPT